MKIRSLIIPSFLALGLSLGLTTSAQARDTHSSISLHNGDHDYTYHHSGYRQHFKQHRRHHRGHGYYKRKHRGQHYGHLNHYRGDRYRNKSRFSGHEKYGDRDGRHENQQRHRQDNDRHDRHGSKRHRS